VARFQNVQVVSFKHFPNPVTLNRAPLILGAILSLGLLGATEAPAKPVAAKAVPLVGIRLQQAVKQTTEASTMALGVSITIDMSLLGKAARGTITGYGISDRQNKSTAFSMDMGSFIKSLAEASGEPIPPKFNDPAIFKMAVISIGSKAYLNYPLINNVGGSPKNKPWILVDTTKLGLDAGSVAASQGADPKQGLDMLMGLSSTATNLGPETLDGVPTTRYSSAMSVEALKKNLSPAQASAVSKLMGVNPSMPVTVWVDAQNRVRRLDATFTVDQSGTKMIMQSTYTFSRFNEPVTISAPPETEVDSTSPVIERIVASAKAKK
jgi:LppX_LprAFG lipoprotein